MVDNAAGHAILDSIVYDSFGNMTSQETRDRSQETLIYDAWDRLVKVTNSSGQIIAQYTYNAQGYAVTVTYPQGGTGIPAGEMNCPGAAAHMRPAAATGRIRISLWEVIRWGGWIPVGHVPLWLRGDRTLAEAAGINGFQISECRLQGAISV